MSTRFSVYILLCSDGTYYVGSAQDVEQRVRRHNEGRAAKYTSVRKPVRLVYSEALPNKNSAIRRERQIKKVGTREEGSIDQR